MSSPRTISFRIAAEKVAELDSIAKAMDRDRSYLLNEAVESYLSEQQRFVAMVNEGREDIRAGRTIKHEEVERMVDRMGTRGPMKVILVSRLSQGPQGSSRLHSSRKRRRGRHHPPQNSRNGVAGGADAILGTRWPRGGNARGGCSQVGPYRGVRDFRACS